MVNNPVDTEVVSRFNNNCSMSGLPSGIKQIPFDPDEGEDFLYSTCI